MRNGAEIDSKLYYADIISENRVKANMGKPNFKPQDIGRLEVAAQPEYEFNSGDETLKFGAVSMGNPHAVLKVENLNDIAKYIKNSDEEIERLGSVNNHLNSELLKIQLELLEYKKKEFNTKKKN